MAVLRTVSCSSAAVTAVLCRQAVVSGFYSENRLRRLLVAPLGSASSINMNEAGASRDLLQSPRVQVCSGLSAQNTAQRCGSAADLPHETAATGATVTAVSAPNLAENSLSHPHQTEQQPPQQSHKSTSRLKILGANNCKSWEFFSKNLRNKPTPTLKVHRKGAVLANK